LQHKSGALFRCGEQVRGSGRCGNSCGSSVPRCRP
jgi:hypothetical protein